MIKYSIKVFAIMHVFPDPEYPQSFHMVHLSTTQLMDWMESNQIIFFCTHQQVTFNHSNQSDHVALVYRMGDFNLEKGKFWARFWEFLKQIKLPGKFIFDLLKFCCYKIFFEIFEALTLIFFK